MKARLLPEPYVVAVLFEVSPDHAEIFRAAVLKNASASLREPGCRRFDVSFSPDSLQCFLYEIYEDSAAFKTHLATPHFEEFERLTSSQVRNKRFETFLLQNNDDTNSG